MSAKTIPPQRERVQQFLSQYPDLFRQSDEKVWREWQKLVWHHYPRGLDDLFGRGVQDRFKARQVVVMLTPRDWCPMHRNFSEITRFEIPKLSRRLRDFTVRLTMLLAELAASAEPSNGNPSLRSVYNSVLFRFMKGASPRKALKLLRSYVLVRLPDDSGTLDSFQHLFFYPEIHDRVKAAADARVRAYVLKNLHDENLLHSYRIVVCSGLNKNSGILHEDLLLTQIEFLCRFKEPVKGISDVMDFLRIYLWLQVHQSPRSQRVERKLLTALFTQCKGVQRCGTGNLQGRQLIVDVHAKHGKSRSQLGVAIRKAYAAMQAEAATHAEHQQRAAEVAAEEAVKWKAFQERLDKVLAKMKKR